MRIAIAVSLPFLAFGCKTPNAGQSDLNSTEVRNFEDELGMKPGVGFDGILEDVRGVCAQFDAQEKGGGSQEAVYQVKLVESHRDLLMQLDVSSGSQVKAAVPDENIQASRKTKFAMGTTFQINHYSVYLLVSAKIRNETTNLSNLRLTEEAKALVAKEGGIEAFRAQCGDSFLRAFTTGGEYQALIEVQADSDQLAMSLKNNYGQKFSAGAAVTGTSQGELEAGIASLTSGRNVRIWTYQRGGQGEEEVGFVSNVGDMMARLKRLADSARQGQNPRPLTATFSDYMTLGAQLPVSYRTQLQNAQDVISDLAGVQQRLLDLSGDIAFIMQKPEAFVGVTGSKIVELGNAKSQVDVVMKKIRDRGRACSLSLADCVMTADIAVPNVQLPKRKPTLESLAHEKLRIKSTATWVDVDNLYDGWFNPPECYLKVNVGGNGNNNFAEIRRTAITFPTPRCSNLTDDIRIPMSIIKDVLSRLGVPLDKGWIQLVAMEADSSYDDHIANTWVYLRDLQNGAVTKDMTGSALHADVGFEIEN